MKDVFIRTENFRHFEELVNELLSSSLGVEMAAVMAPYGRGKTTAAQRIRTLDTRVVYVCFEPRFSLAGLIREIAFQIAGVRPRMSQAAVDVIQDAVSRERKLIMVDEADQMSIRHLNQLRAFHDLHHVPIILIGEDSLHRKLAREGRLISRVRVELRLRPIGMTEVVTFYRKAVDSAVTPDQAKILLRHSGGDFRKLIVDAVHVARLLKVNSLSGVTDAIVKAVVKENGS